MCDRRRSLTLTALVLAGWISWTSRPAFGQQAPPTLHIAAAADLEPLLPPILAAFEGETGVRADASYQSSATLATEILSGAPFDLFLAADLSFPQRVVDGGKAEEAHPSPYARGTLVLWSRNDSGIHSLSMEALRGAAVRAIAMANPEHAPYGRAAQAALEHEHLLDVLRAKLVISENIAQAAQYADSANAQAGFISLTSALTARLKKDGHFVPVPVEDYPPIVQGAVVIRGSANASAARRFLGFLRTPAVGGLLAAGGLEPTS